MAGALAPVSVGVLDTLSDPSLMAFLPDGVLNEVPPTARFPLCWYEVQEEQDFAAFGEGHVPELDLRVHVAVLDTLRTAQQILSVAWGLLNNATLVLDGYDHIGRVLYERTVALPDQLINGVRCHEVVALFRVYVEKQA